MNKLKKIPKWIFIVFQIILLWSCNTAADSPYANIVFTQKKSMPGIGRASAVAFAIGEKAYVTLGRDPNNYPLTDCWEYNSSTDTWSQKAPFPDSARVKAIAAVVHGKAYVGLGFYQDKANAMDNSAGMLKSFWMYNPINDKWTERAKFPGIATDACISFILKDDIYVGTGFNGTGFSKDIWRYSTITDNWFRMPDFGGIAKCGAVCSADSSHQFIGTGYSTINDNDWWEFMPQTNSWKKKKSLPDNGRVNGVGLVIKGRYFVSTGREFGGNLTGGHVKSDILEYDTQRDLWYKRGSIPASGRENSIAFTIGGKGYIGMGENDSEIINDLWSFEP